MVYTALARMAAAAGRPAEAHAAARALAAAPPLPVRLRTFVPALQAYCAAGDVESAFQARAALGAPALCWLAGCRRCASRRASARARAHSQAHRPLRFHVQGGCRAGVPEQPATGGTQARASAKPAEQPRRDPNPEPRRAAQVEADIAAAGLDLTEDEFAALLRACAARGGAARAPALLRACAARGGAAPALLARIGRELTRLAPPTLVAAEAYFRRAT